MWSYGRHWFWTIYQIFSYWGRSAETRRCVANAQYLKEAFLDKGVMGLQAGQGYYSYPEPSYHQLGFSNVSGLSKVSELASKAKLI
jgi:3-hydroxybutyryl-CoA dehydrogenase